MVISLQLVCFYYKYYFIVWPMLDLDVPRESCEPCVHIDGVEDFLKKIARENMVHTKDGSTFCHFSLKRDEIL
jgi:hypothetical protein